MFISRDIQTQHKDLIHDFDFDYYGRRLATCSSDQMMKVWDLKEDGEWHCTASWRTHNGSVWRICWSYPEYGQVIATCSFDKTVTIWEEVYTGVGSASSNNLGLNNSMEESMPAQLHQANVQQGLVGKTSGATNNVISPHWVRRCNLVDARASVTDVRFCPRHLGLQLATCSTDDYLRIYEAPDVMNVSQWTLQQNIPTCPNASCLSWSQSRYDQPLLAVGSSCKENNSSPQMVSNAPMNTSRSIAHNSSNMQQVSDNQPGNASFLEIFEYIENTRQWMCAERVYQLQDPVLDVSFAPNMGKSYHTLAVASDQGFLVLYLHKASTSASRIIPKPIASENPQAAPTLMKNSYTIRMNSEQSQQRGRVWRVNWNVTGTLLCTAGDDGVIKLWMRNCLDSPWSMVAYIEPDKPDNLQFTSTVDVNSGNDGPVQFQKAGPIHHLTKNVPSWH